MKTCKAFIKNMCISMISEDQFDPFIFDIAFSFILNHCTLYLNSCVIPSEAYQSIACAVYKKYLLINDSESITSYRAGDLSLSFSDKVNDSNILNELDSYLVYFRKIRW